MYPVWPIVCNILVLFATIKHSHEDSFGDSYFVGGTVARPKQFRAFVTIHGQKKCLGTLVDSSKTNQSFVVTSACCIPSDGKINFLVSADYLTMVNDTVVQVRKYRHASKVIVHPDYCFIFSNNIAIIFLNQPFMRTSSFGPIKLPDRDIPDDANCSVAGWSQDGQITYMDIKVVPRKKYRNDGCYQNHDKNLVIAHDVNAANGPSKDDTGTGLICDNELAGVLNFPAYCSLGRGKGSLLSYYSVVYRYMDFIERNASFMPAPMTILITIASLMHLVQWMSFNNFIIT